MHPSSNPRLTFPGRAMLLGLSGLLALTVPGRGLTLYDFGNPIAEEQLYLELINRARADPSGEGKRIASSTDPDVLNSFSYFGVNLAMMQSEFNAIPSQPPLAPNAYLQTATRGHSAWMLANAIQSHYETNPANDPFSRISAAGYPYCIAGENIYAAAKSVWYGHVGFAVDWGSGTGGMQDPRLHRENLFSQYFHEIGVGVVFGTNGLTGPQVVTYDFGVTTSNPTFATGVAYYDLNSNNEYDIGEGIAGLTVNVSGSDVTRYCTTAIGGGWVVPVPATAVTRTVTFSGPNLNQSASLIIPAGTNAKADLKLTYAAPAITSPSCAVADCPFTVTFNPVGGATGYKWNRWTKATAAAENCESAANITTSTTGTYSVLNTNVKQQGTASFHLENSTASSQWLQLNTIYYGLTSPVLTFQSSVRYATNSEQFKVQIKEEGSIIWQDAFSQTGSNNSGESTFNLRTAAMTGMTGKTFRIRFLLNYGGGAYYGTSGDNVGWFVDAIAFSGVAALGSNTCVTLTETADDFTPCAGTYLMSVAPVISGRDFPPAYQTLTVSPGGTTALAIITQPVSVTVNSGGTATFTVAASGTSPTFQWYAGTSGTTTNPISGTTGTSFTTSPLTATASYWVRATNAAGFADSNTATATVGALINARISLANLATTYDGTAKSATATTTPASLSVTFTYNGSANPPVNAGSYAVVATLKDAKYQGRATGTLVISKGIATAVLGNLAATYDGTAKSATATTTPAGLAVTFTYAAAATPPTNVGSYAVIGTINDTNYQGKSTGTLVISKATATAVLGNLAAIYSGTSKPVTAITTPLGLPVTFTYNGSATMPGNAGTYAVIATINHANYRGTATATLVISKATATVTLGSLAATYNGAAKAATATITPTGLAVTFTYDGLATAPKNVGSYAVVATINNTNYQGGAAGTLVISKGTATTKLGTLAVTYNGSAKPVTATTTPAGLAVILTYNGSVITPANAGSYAIVATVNNPNYQGGTTGTLVISKATATVKLGNLAASYSGVPISPTATTTPAGLAVDFIYNGSATAPTNVGSYAVVATINDTNYKGSITGSLVVSKAAATVALGNLAATYDGTVKSVTATTVPGGLAVVLTYNRTATVPTNVGSYAVVATINAANYKGGTTGTLVVSKAVAGVLAANTRLSNNTSQAGTSSFASWAAALESSNGLAVGTIANEPDADFDHDGRSNLIEYAFGTSPVIANESAPRMPAARGTASHFVLRYQRDTALADLTFTAQASVDLATWRAPGETGAPDGFADTLISTSGTLETHEASIPRTSCGNVFMRVSVTRQ